MIRVYYNLRKEAPLVWCIDTGPGTNVVKATDVVLIKATGHTGFDQNVVGTEEPAGWIEFDPRNVGVQIIDKVAYLEKIK